MSDSQGNAPKARGGLVFTVLGQRAFLSTEVALRLAPRPQVATIPGSPAVLLGLTLSDGVILPVLEVGPDRGAMIVCVHRGEPLGLLGATEIRSGMFVAHGDAGVLEGDTKVPPFDVEAICGLVQAVTWGATWVA